MKNDVGSLREALRAVSPEAVSPEAGSPEAGSKAGGRSQSVPEILDGEIIAPERIKPQSGNQIEGASWRSVMSEDAEFTHVEASAAELAGELKRRSRSGMAIENLTSTWQWPDLPPHAVVGAALTCALLALAWLGFSQLGAHQTGMDAGRHASAPPAGQAVSVTARAPSTPRPTAPPPSRKPAVVLAAENPASLSPGRFAEPRLQAAHSATAVRQARARRPLPARAVANTRSGEAAPEPSARNVASKPDARTAPPLPARKRAEDAERAVRRVLVRLQKRSGASVLGWRRFAGVATRVPLPVRKPSARRMAAVNNRRVRIAERRRASRTFAMMLLGRGFDE